ncbi:MAG TPA: hypothetical protein VGB03_01100 [Acidimicrobiales bacterium]|jgi:ribosomal protein L21
MTTETTASIEPSRRSFRRVTAAAVVGGALLLAGISVAAAQTGDSTPPASDPPAAATQAPAAKAGPRGEGVRGGPDGGGKHGGPGGHALHGEFVVPDGNGGYRTMQVQNGTVTAVSNSSITVKSADGFTKAYVVDEETRVNAGRDGIADVAEGDTVHVDAVVDGTASKARHIHERPERPAKREQPQRQPAA